MPSWKMLHLRCLTGFEFAFVATDYFRNTIGYLFTKFNYNYNIVHGLFHVTLFSTYLLSNENYNSVS